MYDCNDCNKRNNHFVTIDHEMVRKNICTCRCKCKIPCKGPCRAPYPLPCRGLCKETKSGPCKEKDMCKDQCKKPCKDPCKDPCKKTDPCLDNELLRKILCQLEDIKHEKHHKGKNYWRIDEESEDQIRNNCNDLCNSDFKEDCGEIEICDTCMPWISPIVSDGIGSVGTMPMEIFTNFFSPIKIFLNYVIKKVSCLDIPKCAKQNFIRALMDIQPPILQIPPLPDPSSEQSYQNVMEIILLSIVAKWYLYVTPELACNQLAPNAVFKMFFLDLQNNLPTVPVPFPSDTQYITTTSTSVVQSFITNDILKI